MANISEIETLLKEGIIHQQQQEYDAALDKYDAVLRKIPRQIDAIYYKSLILRTQGNYQTISELLTDAIEHPPTEIRLDTLKESLKLLGYANQKLHDWEGAIKAYTNGLSLDPQSEDRWVDLIQCLIEEGKLAQAQERIHTARRSGINGVRILCAQAEIYWKSWQVSRCLDCLRDAVQKAPTNLDIVSQYLLVGNYIGEVDESNAAKEHTGIMSALQNLYRANIQSVSSTGKHSKQLNVGFLGPDMLTHSVSYFLLPLLKGLKNRNDIQTFSYSTNKKEDKTTEQIKKYSDNYQNLIGKNAPDHILKDKLDILVDLAGHTSGNSIPLLLNNQKLATHYISWLGYPNTTGMPLIDYRFVDAMTDPNPEDEVISERRINLTPCFLCYEPPKNSPEVSSLPCSSVDHVTIGCFNNLNKVTPEFHRFLVNLLQKNAKYRLLLKSPMFTLKSVRHSFIRTFELAGIQSERLLLVERTKDTFSHLEAYHQVDLTIDTYPYNGTTTTFESLFMGCPVITRTGRSHRSRVSSSILNCLNKQEWIATNEEELISKIERVLQDREQLESTRLSLRDQLLSSSLCNQTEFARQFEHACRAIQLEANELKNGK